MIEQLWLHPPLAFARLGPSETPCDNYRWGPNDLTPRGTGKTTVVPDVTLDVAADGTVTQRTPNEIIFKDSDGFRPVCPFFEPHGSWTSDGRRHSGPITPAVLAEHGLTTSDTRWRVEVANIKPFHYTLNPDDQVRAVVDIAGDDHTRHPLAGRSPADADRPLVPPGAEVPLGSVRLCVPNEELPELRLRFTPAAGHVYGPTDLAERTSDYELPADRLILNPAASWCGFSLDSDDPRTNPGGLFAGAENNEGVGLVDDVCDGTVTVTLGGLSATARIVVGPPDFAPDRRPFVSIADGLTDRDRRGEVREPEYLADIAQTTLEIRDLFERTLETMDAVNVDVQNERAGFENAAIARAAGLSPENAREQAFRPPEPLLGVLLGLTERGRRRHRRFVALEALEDLIREHPELLRRILREPVTDDRYYDRRMPVAMRGSDRYPLHLTRRQYDLIAGWARSLRADIEVGT